MVARPGGVFGGGRGDGRVPADDDPAMSGRAGRFIEGDRRHARGSLGGDELDRDAVDIEFERRSWRGEEESRRLAEHL